MRYTFDGSVNDDGSWGLRAHVPNGQTVTKGDLVRVLLFAAAQLESGRADRLPTLAEEEALEAERRLPDGWEATGDGINTEVVLGEGQRFSRTYRRMDGPVLVAPCAQDGSALPATRAALIEHDALTPIAES